MDFHCESGDGGVKEYPAPDLSLRGHYENAS